MQYGQFNGYALLSLTRLRYCTYRDFMETRLLTVKEVAGIARVHPVSVRRWIIDGKLASVRIGGVRRISFGALLDFLEDSSRESGQGPGKGDAA